MYKIPFMLLALVLQAGIALAETPVVSIEYDDPSEAAANKKAKRTAPPSVMEYRQAMNKMHRDMDITYTGDADVDFAKGMVPHHQGAVEMAQTELKYGKDENMRELAAWIIRSQTQEIAQMTQWLRLRGFAPGPGGVAGKEVTSATTAYKEAAEHMHHGMHIKYTGVADVDFARGMIPHHQGAIDMARVQRKHGKNLELNRLADGIILSQQQEIGRMKRWLEKHDAKK